MSGIITVKKNKNYSVVSNYFIRDPRMDLKCIGLLSKIMSAPPNFKITVENVALMCQENKDTIMRILNKLEELHYLKKERVKSDGGRFAGYDYSIYEVPYDADPDQVPPLLNVDKMDKRKGIETDRSSMFYWEKGEKEEKTEENVSSMRKEGSGISSIPQKSDPAIKKQPARKPEPFMPSPYTEKPYAVEPYAGKPYTVTPEPESPYPDSSDTVNADMDKPDMDTSDTESPYMDKPYMDSPYTVSSEHSKYYDMMNSKVNTAVSSTTGINTIKTITTPVSTKGSKERNSLSDQGKEDRQTGTALYIPIGEAEKRIKKLISYDEMMRFNDRLETRFLNGEIDNGQYARFFVDPEIMDEVIRVVSDFLSQRKKPEFLVVNEERINMQTVIDAILNVDQFIMIETVAAYKAFAGRIEKNRSGYILTVIVEKCMKKMEVSGHAANISMEG